MSNSGQAQEPTMEEILASIRRIISEDSTEEEGEAAPEAAPEAPPSASEPEESFELEEEGEVLELTDALPEEPVSAAEPAPFEEPAPAPEPEPVAYSEPEAEIEDDFASLPAEDNVVEPRFSQPEPTPLAADEPEFDPEDIEDDVVAAAPQAPDFVEDAEAPLEAAFDEEDDIVFEELSEEPEMSAENAEPLLSEAANSNLMSRVTEDATAAAFGALSSSLVTSTGEARTLEELVGELLRPMLKEWLDENLPSMVEEMVREEIERVSRKRR